MYLLSTYITSHVKAVTSIMMGAFIDSELSFLSTVGFSSKISPHVPWI